MIEELKDVLATCDELQIKVKALESDQWLVTVTATGDKVPAGLRSLVLNCTGTLEELDLELPGELIKYSEIHGGFTSNVASLVEQAEAAALEKAKAEAAAKPKRKRAPRKKAKEPEPEIIERELADKPADTPAAKPAAKPAAPDINLEDLM